ncbi:MAG TPA: hypothetical protein VN428_22900 [Bryobacteraceae bacterium]|nr:hypothetical protein [Bryobacteraceae bacterium]
MSRVNFEGEPVVFIRSHYTALFLTALFLAVLIVAPSALLLADTAKQTSSPRPPVPCDNPEEPGAMFYDFKKLVIYYMDFTHPDDEKRPGYSEILKYENFNKALVEQVRNNFTRCLTTFWGRDKPIVVAPPLMRSNGEKYAALKALRQEAYDPANLTIVISLNYGMFPLKRPEDINVGHIGLARFQFYRPGLSGHDAMPLVPNKSVAIILLPHRGADELQAHLAQFFASIKPTNSLGWDKWPSSPHGPRTMK